ncbi:CLUMA_CG017564, isoform A [Clunio marinus]|uniref:CLUMA_CG017564, isoform A n=1 Tax=Clunio marinus TaxID=568069 RepID=A0A1J1IW27_9DIPT|nr:CLUMA_CG017564, isoform A [Clunio marinus]
MINDLNKVGDSRSKIDKIETKHPAITSSGVNEKPQGVENNERRICKCKTANYKMNEKTDSLTISNKACNHMNLVKLEKNKIDKTITITLDNCVVPNRRRKNLMNPDVQGRIFEFSFQNQLSVIDSSDSSFDRVDLNRSFHVMKCFALFWILFLNVTTTLSYAANNLRYIESKGESFIANFIFKNGSLSINTFFFINGVALCQMFFTSSKDLGIHKIKGVSKHLQHYIFLIVYKIFKLFLPYITTIHLLRMFMKYFNENSILTIPSNDHFTCENIFTKLAFLDLYSPYSERCMLWTWYLSTEIQFFAISLLILMLSRNHPRYAFTIFVSFYLSTFYTTTTINVETNRVTHISNLTSEEKLMFFNGIYEHPILHLGPYLVGIFFGCLSCNLNKKVKINSVCLSIGWIIALTLYCLVSFYKVDNVNNLWMKYGFFALSHTFWALILLWISFVTMTSSGELTVLLRDIQTLMTSMFVVTFVGLAAISIMASLTFYICFETPITTTLHIMYKKLVESQNE